MSDISVNAAKPLVPALASVTKALSPYAEPLVRIATGLLLVPHGTQKLFGWFGGYGIAGTEQFFATKLGLPPWVAVLAGLVEFGGGLLLALGLVTRVAAALVVGLMTVAIIQVMCSACPPDWHPAQRVQPLAERAWAAPGGTRPSAV